MTSPRTPLPAPDVDALGDQLLGRWREQRRQGRQLALDPRMQRVHGESLRQHRDRVVAALGYLVEADATRRAIPKRFGGADDPGGNIAGFEEIVLADPSIAIKGGVQWGLFGAAVLHLGTATHHERWLPGIFSLEIPGAFAMTETGHGSDVAQIGTTAVYDPETEEFVIHTPFRGAWKDYLGHAAEGAHAAVVFAQLHTLGEHHGVHAFYVPVRDPGTGAYLPGVGGEDDGVKGGLNGIDNGRLWFDRVRIPRDHLLDRYGSVAPDGTYTSPIASPGRRFFTMLGTLVQGRVSLDGSATVAAKKALTIAIRYGDVRRQFSPERGAAETVVLDYGRHQRRLLPRLAETYAMSFAHEELLERFDAVFSGRHDDDEHRQELETMAASLKPLSTWGALDILQEAREACGGAGFLAENEIAPLRADLDVWATFEGDNNVLLQLAGKRLVGDFARRMASGGAAAHAVRTAAGRLGLRRTGGRGALGAEGQHRLLADRAATRVADVATRLAPARRLGARAASELFNRHQNDLILAARAHAELLQWEAFTRAVDAAGTPENRVVLAALRDLFALTRIEADAGWFLANRRLTVARARAVTAEIDGRFLPALREHAVALVDAFEIPDALLRAPIALGAERARQEEARAVVAAGDAVPA